MPPGLRGGGGPGAGELCAGDRHGGVGPSACLRPSTTGALGSDGGLLPAVRVAWGPACSTRLGAGRGWGAAIEVEVWELPREAVGGFLEGIPALLGIGTVELEDGGWEKGFVCEGYGVLGAEEITGLGGGGGGLQPSPEEALSLCGGIRAGWARWVPRIRARPVSTPGPKARPNRSRCWH